MRFFVKYVREEYGKGLKLTPIIQFEDTEYLLFEWKPALKEKLKNMHYEIDGNSIVFTKGMLLEKIPFYEEAIASMLANALANNEEDLEPVTPKEVLKGLRRIEVIVPE